MASPSPHARALEWVFDPLLIPGRLVRRDNRFIATVRLDTGRTVKAHCTNTGSLMGVVHPGRRVMLRPESGQERRTKFTWVMVRHGRHWVGVDTLLPNRLLFQAVRAGGLPELGAYPEVRREVPYGERSRVDLLLSAPGDARRPDCYVEIKNCHLTARTLDPGIPGPRVPRRFRDIALFPDAVTERGRRHLHELAREVASGHRGVLVVAIQRNDCDAFGAAAGIDPAYARDLEAVAARGVEVYAYACTVSPQRVRLARRLPVLLTPYG